MSDLQALCGSRIIPTSHGLQQPIFMYTCDSLISPSGLKFGEETRECSRH